MFKHRDVMQLHLFETGNCLKQAASLSLLEDLQHEVRRGCRGKQPMPNVEV